MVGTTDQGESEHSSGLVEGEADEAARIDRAREGDAAGFPGRALDCYMADGVVSELRALDAQDPAKVWAETREMICWLKLAHSCVTRSRD